MLSVNQAKSYLVPVSFPLLAPLSWANTKGNGLIVVGIAYATADATMNIQDYQGDTFVSLGSCIASANGVSVALHAWYVASCKGGPNETTMSPLYTPAGNPIGLFGFEYAGGFSAPDGSDTGSGAGLGNLTLSSEVKSSQDLVFSFVAQFGSGTVALDANSGGFTTELSYNGAGASNNQPASNVVVLAADETSAPGSPSVTFDLTQTGGGGQAVAIMVSLPWPVSSGGGGGTGSGGSGILSFLDLAAIPGFFDIGDDAIAAGNPCSDDILLKLSHNGKFASVRSKLIFMGFFADGNTVPTPIDPDDGYGYSRPECQYVWMLHSNRSPAAGFVPGQAAPPAQSNSQPGTLYNWPGGNDVNDATGQVTLRNSYWQNGQEVVANDGILKVYAVCLRLSTNQSN